MKKWFLPLSAVLLLGVTIVFIELSSKFVITDSLARVELGGAVVMAEVADTPETRSKGLSGKPFLSDNGGMLFIFEDPGKPGFWMKDMRFALDIIWIDSNRKVVDLSSDLRPETYPQVFIPAEPVLYVLEVKAGFINRYDVSIGDPVEMVLP